MAGARSTVALADGWREALERGRFPALLDRLPGHAARIVILVDLAGARPSDPSVPPPALVEELIDYIHARTGIVAALAASADDSHLWAGNRDIYALADLLGYRFTTGEGHGYDLLDLAENLVEAPFRPGSALHGTMLSADWLEADLRLNLARLHSHRAESFAGGLLNLLACLPQADKVLHYRHRRDTGIVIAELLAACPPHHTLVVAGDVAEGEGGAHFAAASASPLLADYAAALKAGLDPFASPLVSAVAAEYPLPAGVTVDGALDPIALLDPPPPLALASARLGAHSEAGDRLLATWLQPLDPQLFPANRPLDAKAGEWAADLAQPAGPAAAALRAAAQGATGAVGHAVDVWRTLFDKDSLVRRVVPLGLDPQAISPEDYDALVPELEALLPIAAAAPERGPHLRWRTVEKAVLFQYRRTLAIPFDLFVEKVDVARTISFMNDYLGGVVVVRDRDDQGRAIRQAERNLYLPQPNYVVLYGGQPIDVTKIETVRYDPGSHRLFWKTLHSTNGSATADDGIAAFERAEGGTRVTIAGKQRFTLPPALRLFDLALLPEVETPLTTHAYQRFFDRTLANFEALVEGRDIAIGRPAEEETPHPSITLERWLAAMAEQASPLLARLQGAAAARPPADAQGFVHVEPHR